MAFEAFAYCLTSTTPPTLTKLRIRLSPTYQAKEITTSMKILSISTQAHLFLLYYIMFEHGNQPANERKTFSI